MRSVQRLWSAFSAVPDFSPLSDSVKSDSALPQSPSYVQEVPESLSESASAGSPNTSPDVIARRPRPLPALHHPRRDAACPFEAWTCLLPSSLLHWDILATCGRFTAVRPSCPLCSQSTWRHAGRPRRRFPCFRGRLHPALLCHSHLKRTGVGGSMGIHYHSCRRSGLRSGRIRCEPHPARAARGQPQRFSRQAGCAAL